MKTIHNPVLRGFDPDPSFLRVGDDYHIATSTFEWVPGVQLHHSRDDLIHSRLIGHALRDKKRLDLVGSANSGGVWAPSLSWQDGEFFLIDTNVRTGGMGRPHKDTPVYLTTTRTILSPWSDPVHLSSSGFDPSLLHDDDGRKWLMNMAWDFRKGKSRFAGITIQEYAHDARRVFGPIRTILQRQLILEAEVEEGGDRTRTATSPRDDLGWLRKTVAGSAFPPAEIHLTEWSSSPSPRDHSHDSLPAATFVIRANIESTGSVDSLSYRVVTDIFEESGGGDTVFGGGFGLINYQGIVKPAFHAHRFPHLLGREEIGRVPGIVATRKDDGHTQVLGYHSGGAPRNSSG